jgi:hypothetical protein
MKQFILDITLPYWIIPATVISIFKIVLELAIKGVPYSPVDFR